ncbi:hypothetical protein D3C81_789990 [compost metagenome]
MFGSVTFQNICQALAPSVSAASSSSLPCCSISGINSRAMNGNVTNTVASTMPGMANTMRGNCSSVSPSTGRCTRRPSSMNGQNQPSRPNNRMNTSPATTGDTENGRSIKVTNQRFPGKLCLLTTQAAATPKTRFNGTTMAVTMSVSFTADNASGSLIATQNACTPPRKASTKTSSNGSSRNDSRKPSAPSINSTCTQRGSLVTR